MALIGIDLGTTNSLVCVWEAGKSIVIPNAIGERFTPSVISYDDKNDEIIIGRAAKERLVSHPLNTIASFKRSMGTQNLIKLGTKEFKPEELSALLLRQLKEDAETFLGCSIDHTIISVPAYFSDAQRKATKIAGELAGLNVERLINEPTAAALAYGLHDKYDEQLFMVVDLGGGTLDVSVLDIFEGVIEVRASAGDNFFGGEDFTQLLVGIFLEENGISRSSLSVLEQSRLLSKVESLKHSLSNEKHSHMAISLQGESYQWRCSKKQFEDACRSLIQRFSKPIERALVDSRIDLTELDNIILVGGATRMSWVRAEVAKLFKRLPSSNINPDEVVAQGAAIQSALKSRDSDFQEVILTDICPYTLGVEIAVERATRQFENGHFLPIIERNMTIPVSREHRLYSIYDDQSQIVCRIFQGESRLVKRNIYLGEITTQVIKAKAGQQFVDVRFTYDINGILEVLLKVGGTERTERLVIKNSVQNLTAEEIEKSLSKLADIKVHPREKAQSKVIVSKLERLYEECLGESREHVADVLNQFEKVLQTQDSERVEKAIEEIEVFIEDIRGRG